MTLAILVALVALFLGACGAPATTPDAGPGSGDTGGTATATPAEPPPATPTVPPPTPAVMADCFLSFQAAAWQDLDGDGLWGATEPPLEGVEFRLQGMFAQVWGDPFLSGADGRLAISTWSPGECFEQDCTLSAVPPEAYEPTTPISLTLSLTPAGSVYEAQFGFRPVSE